MPRPRGARHGKVGRVAKPRKLLLQQLALVPVGHEVEVRFFRKPKRSAWDGSVKDLAGEAVLDEAVVRDRVSGVLFGRDWHFQPGLDSPREDDASSQLILVETLEGRVSQCQVVTRMIGPELQIETWLTIEPS
jgi:hypothetical protein